MTLEEIERLGNEELLQLLATECGISTYSQLKTFFDATCVDLEKTFETYGFGEWDENGLHLNKQGRIAAEVIDRFME